MRDSLIRHFNAESIYLKAFMLYGTMKSEQFWSVIFYEKAVFIKSYYNLIYRLKIFIIIKQICWVP